MIVVNYTDKHWKTLEELRKRTIMMLNSLEKFHIHGYAYGSISRGDIHPESDIDIFIPVLPAPSIFETQIEQAGVKIQYREIIQATPTYTAKGYLYIDEKRGYSFPLNKMKTVEHEFYTYAGRTTKKELQDRIRVHGVDKRLMLIEPTETGHIESPIEGREGTVAKRLNIHVQTVKDRVRTLQRRKRTGRTGVYIKSVLNSDESFGEKYNQLSRTRPALRRRQRRK